jgi:hypothetical protein
MRRQVCRLSVGASIFCPAGSIANAECLCHSFLVRNTIPKYKGLDFYSLQIAKA